MKKLRRWSGGGPMMLALGSCVMAPVASAGPVETGGPRAAAPSPAPSPKPTPAPSPVRGATFRFDGQMIQGGVVLGWAPVSAVGLTLDGAPVDMAADGRFLIAFDRDAKPNALLVARLDNGQEVRELLTVAPRAWRIERLNTLPRISQPDAEFQARRPAELAQINMARARVTDADGWREAFMWPVLGRISGLFGAQRFYKGEPGAYHSGVDIAMPAGTTVLAPADGVVILAADHPFTLEGNLLMIDHGMGLNSAFLHLSRIDVKLGDHVKRGQVIGAIGMSGRATGPHLHWSMKWNTARIDPLLIAGPMPAAD